MGPGWLWVTSQAKIIGHFTAYPQQFQFDFGHFTDHYLLAGVCCPGVLFMCNDRKSNIDYGSQCRGCVVCSCGPR